MGRSIPNFIVIGGMKCATTTLHQDLDKHPQIFCGRKELNALVQDPERSHSTEEVYQYNYRDAAENQLLGDVSTHYSMLPTHQGIPQIAKRLCGEQLKIIYIVREPIRRALSHHQHLMNDAANPNVGPDVNLEINTHPEIVAYSQYAMQLLPWVDAFGMDQITVVKFEDYTSNRLGTLEQIFDFLDVEKVTIDIEDEGANRSHNKHVAGGTFLKFWKTPFFQRVVRPLAPDTLRRIARKVLLSKAKLVSIPPNDTTIRYIFDSVSEDSRLLQQLTGRDEPLWNLAAAWSQYLNTCPQTTEEMTNKGTKRG